MLRICEEIFTELNRNAVNYCHWKSNEHLMEGLDGITDLDLLVCEEHKDIFAQILSKNNCIKVSPQYGSRYPKVEEWVGYDERSGKLIHLHVHFLIITGTKHVKEYILPWHELALNTKILDETGSVYIMEPHLEIIILYMRIVLKESGLIGQMNQFEPEKGYCREIAWLKERIDNQKLETLLGQIWEENQAEVLEIITKKRPAKRDFAVLQELARQKVQSMQQEAALKNKYKHTIRKQVVNTKALLKNKFELVPFTKQKTLCLGGVSFAFIGCDGSGKSNLTNEICKWLSWKLDCQNYYFGMGDRYKKPFIFKLSKCNWLPEEIRKGCSLLFYYLVSVRCKRMHRAMEAYVKKGGIAICDRYPQTQYKGIYDGPKIKSLGLCGKSGVGAFLAKREEKNLLRVEKKCVDCLFKLIVPPEVAVKRSPSHSLKEVSCKAKITEKLQFPQTEVYEIDATQPFEQELLQVKGIIWKKLVESQLL